MNVLVAVDSFKGSLSTNELSSAIEEGIHQADQGICVTKIPVADGGEGTCDALLEGLGGTRVSLTVKGPLFDEVLASYGILNDGTAVMEMAASSGLPLVPEALRNPMNTTTYGVGEMIRDAMGRGCREFIVGIGGSATNDGGMGMLEALGYRFLDREGKPLVSAGRSLAKVARISTEGVSKELASCRFLVACDVENPLYGENGAAHVFGPQKGADEATVRVLDHGLRNWAEVVEATFDKSIGELKGAGAAGGLGGGFSAFLNAELKPGVKIIFEHLKMEAHVKEADLVIIGEGRLDAQTSMGKAPSGIAKLASKHGIPVVALAGSVADDATSAHATGISAMFSIADGPMSLEEAMEPERARHLVKKTATQVMRLVLAGWR